MNDIESLLQPSASWWNECKKRTCYWSNRYTERNLLPWRTVRSKIRPMIWLAHREYFLYLCCKIMKGQKKLHAQFQSLVSFKNEHSQFQTQTVKINVYPISHDQFSNVPRHSPKTLPWLKVRLHCKTKRKLNFWVRWLKHVQVASRWN